MFFRFFHLLAIYFKKNRKIIDALQIRKKISLNYLKLFSIFLIVVKTNLDFNSISILFLLDRIYN